MVKVEIKDNVASITIAGETRQFPIKWENGHPCVKLGDVEAGVFIGKTGSKAWKSWARICKNPRYSQLSGGSQWVLEWSDPLRSINRDFCTVRGVAGWWDKVPEKTKSQR